MVGMFAAFELARLLENSGTDMVIINAVCPGLVKTSLGRNLKPSMQTWLGEAYKQYGRVPEEGARAVLFAASTGRDGHGKYLSDCKVKQYVVSDCIFLYWAKFSSGKMFQYG